MKSLLVLVVLALLVACTNQDRPQAANTKGAGDPNVSAGPVAAAAAPSTSERPLAAESNPPGDIPDSQAFISFVSAPGGYSIDVPEGWARSVRGADVSFVDKFDGVSVTVTIPAARSHEADQTQAAISSIESSARAGRDFQISSEKLQAGRATVVTFTSNSAADPVTGKRVRLENQAIIFEQSARTATLALWAPLGADNADQWKLIGSSFRWR